MPGAIRANPDTLETKVARQQAERCAQGKHLTVRVRAHWVIFEGDRRRETGERYCRSCGETVK